MKTLPFEFDNHMSRGQIIFGIIYLPIHLIFLPLLLPLVMPELATDLARLNMIYYVISLAVVMAVFGKSLRAHFDGLADRPGWCFLSILMALGLQYVLSYAAAIIFLVLPEELLSSNPNDELIMDIAVGNSGMVKAMVIFLAPIVEEVLFRGVIFGGLRKRSRRWAYAVSMGIFSAMHVWQYVVAYGDPLQIIYVIQYLPVAYALAWCYERSGTLWAPIGFHMLQNAMSFQAMSLLEQYM